MKKIIYLIVIICINSCGPNRQDKPGSIMPPLCLLLTDSSTRIRTEQIDEGKPVVFIYFRPDCNHCKDETKEIINEMDNLSKIQFYMVSPMPMNDIKVFYNQLNLENYSNIKVALDENLLFYRHFEPKKVPYLAIYNEHKKLIRVHEGEMKIDSILEMVNSQLSI